jgi:hypothetical protein
MHVGGGIVPPAHVPSTHVCPAMHARPHAPQFAALVATSTHAPPHIIRGAAQLGPPPVHMPAVQTAPPVHPRPHIPQFDPSDVTSTQTPAHIIRGAGHVEAATHVPAVHAWPAGHVLPHPPQFAPSVITLMHAPAHATSGDEHVEAGVEHSPRTHDWPAAHALPHVPQCAVSLWASTQTLLQINRGAPQIDEATSGVPVGATSGAASSAVTAPSRAPPPPSRAPNGSVPIAQPTRPASAAAHTPFANAAFAVIVKRPPVRTARAVQVERGCDSGEHRACQSSAGRFGRTLVPPRVPWSAP